MRRGREWLVVAAIVVVLACVSSRSHAQTTYTCEEVRGFISFNEMTVEPPRPRVGDRVTLRFSAEYRVYSVSSLTLVGAEPLLEGDVVIYGDRSGRFELDAVQAGTTSVMLVVVYQTEDRCEDEEGRVFYTTGRYHTVGSQPQMLTIQSALPCVGDCDGDGRVTVDELIRAVTIALGVADLESCPEGSLPGDPIINADDLLTIINNVLNGCP